MDFLLSILKSRFISDVFSFIIEIISSPTIFVKFIIKDRSFITLRLIINQLPFCLYFMNRMDLLICILLFLTSIFKFFYKLLISYYYCYM
jgi:hypothetical protein